MADQLDRDYELIGHNYHPFQLFYYNLQNKRLRAQTEQYEARQQGKQSESESIEEIFENELAAEASKLPPG